MLSLRSTLFSILQNKGKPLEERIQETLRSAHTVFPQKSISEWKRLLLSLEQLDPTWKETLDTLSPAEDKSRLGLEKPLEKLFLYFLYRHTAEAQNKKDFSARVAFAYLGYYVIGLLCAEKKVRDGSCDLQDLAEIARRYSSEIEYSEENTEFLLDFLYDCQ